MYPLSCRNIENPSALTMFCCIEHEYREKVIMLIQLNI